MVLASRKRPDHDRVAGEIRDAGGEALAIACHTGDPDGVEALVGRVVEEWGRLRGRTGTDSAGFSLCSLPPDDEHP